MPTYAVYVQIARAFYSLSPLPLDVPDLLKEAFPMIRDSGRLDGGSVSLLGDGVSIPTHSSSLSVLPSSSPNPANLFSSIFPSASPLSRGRQPARVLSPPSCSPSSSLSLLASAVPCSAPSCCEGNPDEASKPPCPHPSSSSSLRLLSAFLLLRLKIFTFLQTHATRILLEDFPTSNTHQGMFQSSSLVARSEYVSAWVVELGECFCTPRVVGDEEGEEEKDGRRRTREFSSWCLAAFQVDTQLAGTEPNTQPWL